MKLEERSTPACHAQQDESSNSTIISTKRRRDRKSQLLDAMLVRLGPQMPGLEMKPLVVMAQEACPDSSVAPFITDWPPHLPVQQQIGDLVSRGPPSSVSRRLNDMFFTPFNPYIINCEPPRGFMVPKFSVYDGTSDPFDHIMHYRQLMTLDIGNDALLCKVFPASLHGQALLWFHRLLMNSMNNFWDLSESFVGQYLCST